MERITKSQRQGMLRRFAQAMRDAGIMIDSDSIILHRGSKTNGVAYAIEVMRRSGDNSMQTVFRPFGSYHFGFTERECFDRMEAMWTALETAQDVRSRQ